MGKTMGCLNFEFYCISIKEPQKFAKIQGV